MLELSHKTSYDNIFIHYLNKGEQGVWISAVITQGSKSCNVQFYINESCFSRAEPLNCDNIPLEMGAVTVIAEVGNYDLLLVQIILIIREVSILFGRTIFQLYLMYITVLLKSVVYVI